MASINMPSPNKKGPWDALAQALSVAKDIYGITSDMSQLDSAKAKDALDAKIKEQALKKGEMEMSPEYLSQQDERALNKAKQEAKIKGDEERKTAAFKAGISIPKGYERVTDPDTGEEKLVAKSKTLPPDKVLLVNQGNAIPGMLDDLRGTLDTHKGAFGPISGTLSSFNPWDETANTIDAQFRTTAQSFGRYMEGGVLRKEDEDKYRKMFPKLGDTPEVAKNKLDLVERMLVNKQNSDLEALRTAGYDLGGLGNSKRVAPEVPGVLTKATGKKTTIIPEAKAANEIPQVKQVGDAIYIKKGNGWVRQ